MNVTAARLAEVKAVAIAESLTSAQAARTLGVSVSTVRRMREDLKLYAFPYGRQWRYPAWQFRSGAVIPGLEKLVPAITLSMHPAFVRGMMLAPRPRLADGETWTTPRSFLVNGGDPARVASIFEELAAL
ncbi:excisionase family DNA binding protein [Conyzicola nivalis]|uniref:Excisionase family DNA binding protein n=1 Tax=Conyzicola nivalis TaxID=1477021 RepID=A0ABV2QT58_9MICO